MKNISKTIVWVIASLFVLSVFSTCRTIESPKAVVFVYKVDNAGKEWPVNNAEVWLDPPEGTEQPDLLDYKNHKKLTNAYGEVEYDFKYEGIVQVKAQQGSGESSCGQGVLILSYDDVYRERIRLSACYDENEE
jgi:hypothetical protein